MKIPGLSTIAAKIAAGVAVAALIAASILWSLWKGEIERHDDTRDKLGTEQARHAVTRQSVATLELSLGRFVGAGKAARAAQLASIEAQAKGNARLQAQADAIRAEMATWKPDGRCETPGSIMGAEGL